MRMYRFIWGVLLIGFLATGIGGSYAVAQTTTSGLPLPRFVTLRAVEVNLRAGPGTRYPVEWIYKKRGLPVEVVAEFDTWRKIRDWQGTQGWVHQGMLSGQRAVIVRTPKEFLRTTGDETARALAQVENGVVGIIDQCPTQALWCQIRIDSFQGWLPRASVWGLYPHETIEK